MKHFGTLSAVLAAGAIATAGLALGAGSATAATPVTYSCTFTALDPVTNLPTNHVTLPVPVTTTFPTVPLQAGTVVPAGTPVSAKLDLSSLFNPLDANAALVTAAIAQFGITQLGGSVPFGAANPVMLGSVPLTGSLSSAPTGLASLLGGLTGTGTLGAFTPQGSGLEDVTLPASFSLIPSALAGSTPVPLPPIPCTSSTGSAVVVGHVQVSAASTQAPVGALKVTGPKKAKHGKVVVFKVSQPNGTGTVVAKVGKKVVGRAALTNGAATLKAKGLKKGKDKVVFSVGTAKVTVKVTVR